MRAGDGVGEIAARRERHAEDVKDHRLPVAGKFVGLEREQQRVARVARGGIFIRRQMMRHGGERLVISRGQAHGVAKFLHAVGIAAELEENFSRFEMRRGIGGIQFLRGGKFRQRFVQLSQRAELHAGGAVQERAVRPQPDGGAIFGKRIGGTAEQAENVAEVVVNLVAGRIDFDGAGINFQRLFKTALGIERHAEVCQRDVVVAHHRQIVTEKCLAIFPKPDLPFCQENAAHQNDERGGRENFPRRIKTRREPFGGKSDDDENSHQRQVGVAVGVACTADLDEAADRHEHAEKPQPAG